MRVNNLSLSRLVVSVHLPSQLSIHTHSLLSFSNCAIATWFSASLIVQHVLVLQLSLLFVPSNASHYWNTLQPSWANKLHLSKEFLQSPKFTPHYHFSTSPQMSTIYQIEFTESLYWMSPSLKSWMNVESIYRILFFTCLTSTLEYHLSEIILKSYRQQSEFQLKLFWNVLLYLSTVCLCLVHLLLLNVYYLKLCQLASWLMKVERNLS
jgi:hypothetical protein